MGSFFELTGLFDNSWFLFILITIFTATFGRNIIFEKLQIPVITGYMFLGFMCGPYVLNIMNVQQTGELGYVNAAALSFIAFSAGAEIYLPEILPLLKPILWVSFGMITCTMIIGTLFTFLMIGTPLFTWLDGYSACNFGVSMLVATILSARSPTSILAVVRELQASGPITHVMIGITVAGDVFVLTIFAIVQALTFNLCSGSSFNAGTFFVNIVMIPAAAVWGYGLGYILLALLNFKKLKHLILPIGFLTVLTCQFILKTTAESAKITIDIDSLLVCITAGFIAGNSPKREKLVTYFKFLSPYVFIPFFTQVGLQLNLPVLIGCLGFAILASTVRAFAMFLGTWQGGQKAGLDRDKAMRLWVGLLPQAGVSIGLAGIIGEQFGETFGRDFQSTMIGVILVNQIVGPLGAKFLIKYCHEDNKAGTHEDGMKNIAHAMNDGHMARVGAPVSDDTQTEAICFDILAGEAQLVQDEQSEPQTPLLLLDHEADAHSSAEKAVEDSAAAAVTRPANKITRGGVEIVNMTNQHAVRTTHERALGDRALMQEIVMNDFNLLQRNAKELLGMIKGYVTVSTDENGNNVETLGQMTANPIISLYQLITEKEEDHSHSGAAK